jgi:hypothetical protein
VYRCSGRSARRDGLNMSGSGKVCGFGSSPFNTLNTSSGTQGRSFRLTNADHINEDRRTFLKDNISWRRPLNTYDYILRHDSGQERAGCFEGRRSLVETTYIAEDSRYSLLASIKQASTNSNFSSSSKLYQQSRF